MDILNIQMLCKNKFRTKQSNKINNNKIKRILTAEIINNYLEAERALLMTISFDRGV